MVEAVSNGSNIKTLMKEALPAFVKGAIVVVVLYVLLIAVAFLRADGMVERLEADLPSETVSLATAVHEIDEHHSEAPHVEDVVPVIPGFTVPVSSDDSLVDAPLAALAEERDGGILPRKGADGLTVFHAYRRPTTLPAAGVPVIALGMLNYGLSEKVAAQAIKDLVPDVSFMASSYAPNVEQWVSYARNAGHEVWLSVPFQTVDYPNVDSGPNTILKRSSLHLNTDRLEAVMGKTTGYVGLWGEVDATFAQAETMMKSLFKVMFSRGVGYLEVGREHSILAESLAADDAAAYLKSTIVIDGTRAQRNLDLENLLKRANDYGSAIGVFEPTPAMLDSLPQWISRFEAEGVKLVPVSAIYDYSNR